MSSEIFSEVVVDGSGSVASRNDWQTMVKRIEVELKRPSSSDQIQIALCSAMDHYKHYQFEFNEGTHEWDLSVDEQEYELEDGITVTAGLPEDFLAVHTAYLRTPATRYLEIDEVDIDDIRWLTPTSNVVGLAGCYALYQKKIYVTPIPSQTDIGIRIDYLRDLGHPWYKWDGTQWKFYYPNSSTILDGTYTNPWLDEGEELIRARAKWDLFYNYLDDIEEAQKQLGFVDDALGNMRHKHVTQRKRIQRTPTRV